MTKYFQLALEQLKITPFLDSFTPRSVSVRLGLNMFVIFFQKFFRQISGVAQGAFNSAPIWAPKYYYE